MVNGKANRVAVITGASAGIGKAAAIELARQGWRIIATGRDPERSRAAAAEIATASGGQAKVDMVQVDLALLKDTARAVDEIAGLTDRVDVLLNNAGGTANGQRLTEEGNEATFAGNHLGHFLLTTRLLPLLRTAAAKGGPGAARIVNVSSIAHRMTPGLDWSNLQLHRDFSTGLAYCNAKLANVLFARELAKRLAPDGIIAHSMHPGTVSSNFASYADEQTQRYIEGLKDEIVTPEEGADTLVWLATAPEAGETSGGYFYLRSPAEPGVAAQDDFAAKRLWHESEALVARAGV